MVKKGKKKACYVTNLLLNIYVDDSQFDMAK
jgi:hypothetical protein